MDIEYKRAYVGGLSKDITEKDLESRFSSFGVVSKVDVIRQPTGECRGFAYVTLKTTENGWKKCVSLFNGAKWKGTTLKIQEARPDYKQRLKSEWEIQKSLEENAKLVPSDKKRRRGRSCVEVAEDMSLVTDDNAEHREGWKKSKYGRAISVVRLKKDDGTRITIDPSRYKGNLLKFSNDDIGFKPKPLVQLPYFYEEYENIKEKQQPLIILNGIKLDENKSQDEAYSDDESPQNNFSSLFPIITNSAPISTQTHLPPSIINDLKKLRLEKEANKCLLKQEQSNQIRLEALKQRAQEKRTEKEKITQALRSETALNNTNHIVFNDNDDQKQDTMTLFDSDDSDKNESVKEYDIVINPLFEGVLGRDRLNLQKKFHGDERFKLTEDFVSEEEDEDAMNKLTSNIDGDEITKSLKEERENQFYILEEMFGDDMKYEQLNLKKKEFQWKNMVHFDPDAPEAISLEVSKQEVNDDLSKFVPLPSQPLPKVSKDVKVAINADLKGLFVSEDRPSFSLFSDNGDTDTENTENEMQLHDEDESILIDKNVSSITDEGNQKLQVSSEPLFFFHLGNNELSKRSHFRELKMFMRTSSVEDIISHWQETSHNLTKEYKRKHKSVSRKLNKIKKKR